MNKWDSEVIRMFFAQAHYRSPPDFSQTALENTRKGLERIYRLKERLEELSTKNSVLDENKLTEKEKQYLASINEFKQKFEQAMDDDFNTPEAFAQLFDYINTSNSFLERNEHVDAALCKYGLEQLLKLGNILTLFQPKKTHPDETVLFEKLQKLIQKYKEVETEGIEVIIKTLIDIREEERKKKNWQMADRIRKELEDIGIEIQDTNKGPVWKKRL